MAKAKLYLQVIIQDVEATLFGPFRSEKERLQAAINHRRDDPDKKDGLFKLDIVEGKPKVSTFYGEDLDGKDLDDEDL